MKVVILGAGGQLGSELTDTAPNAVSVHPLTRNDCDITDETGLRRIIDRISPDCVVNAAAYTAVDRAETEESAAMAVNAQGARNVAAAAERARARVIHVSSDYVFDGTSLVPYTPEDRVSPINAYGRSKAAGEVAVLETNRRSMIVRSGWLYSRLGHNFVKTIIRLLRERDTLRVVDDQVGVPTSASDLAHSLWWLVMNEPPNRTTHWVNAGRASWYDFAVAINEAAAGRGLIPTGRRITPVSTEEYGAAARRPAFSVLEAADLWRLQGAEARDWRLALRDTIDAL